MDHADFVLHLKVCPPGGEPTRLIYDGRDRKREKHKLKQ